VLSSRAGIASLHAAIVYFVYRVGYSGAVARENF